jgi:TRAP-type C4-dicarboxylate transport system substrate-binding protein
MKRFVFILTALLLLACLAGSLAACGSDNTEATQSTEVAGSTDTTAAQVTGDTVVLRLAAPHPAGDPVTECFQKEFVDKFNAQAGGKYKIEIHPGGSLVSVPDSFEAVRNGAVEMGEWAIAVFGSVDPVFNMAELPFSVNSIEADAAYTQQMQKVYDKVASEKYNMKCVFAFTCQGLDIISAKPVKALEDWKGLLCQTISPPTANVVKLLDGAGVALDFAEGYQAMQKKVIEASLQSGSMIIMFKMNEVADYLTRAYLTPASIALWMNLDAYNKMPDDIKAIFDKCSADAQTAINNTMIQYYKENYAKMTELGLEVYPLPSSERDRWAEACKPYSQELLGAVDADVATQVKQITEQLDKQYPYQD